MLKLIGQMERFDIHGRKRMLPHMTFRIHRKTQIIAINKFSFVWLGPEEPTHTQWVGIVDKELRPKIEKAYGKDLAGELIRTFQYNAEPVV